MHTVFVAGLALGISWAARSYALEFQTDSLIPFPETAQPLVVSYDPSTETLNSLNIFLGADTFMNAGVWGQGASVANIESGHFWIGHESLSHISPTHLFTGVGALSDYSEHATAVAQVIAGLGPEVPPGSGSYSYLSLGMAPGASLYSGAIATSYGTDGAFDISDASFLSAYAHYFGAVDVINSSWGSSGDSSGADFFSMAIDALARANPQTTMVAAAGNEGSDELGNIIPNSVGAPAAGFNLISVGALDPAHPYTGVADFSSRGPGDFINPDTAVTNIGVRATVDISAPGVNVGAAYTTNIPTAYYAVNGTSFAAPLVAGGATLMASASRILEADANAVAAGWSADARDARVIKAVLMNSADRLAGWTNGTVVSNGVEAVAYLGGGSMLTEAFSSVAITQQGLDYEQGTGRMNLDRAFEGYTSMYWTLDEVALESDRTYTFNGSFEAGQTMAGTLVWFADRQMGTGYDYSDPDQVLAVEGSLVNAALANLNLELWDASFSTLYATSRSLYNTTEHFVFQLPETQQYALRVTFDNMVFGAAPSTETFALAWNVIPEPAAALLLPMSGLILFLRRRWKQTATC